MKKLLLILPVVAMLGCQQKSNALVNQDKQSIAESLVNKYLDSTMNDPKSYEPVKFGKFDTLRDSYEFSPGKKLLQQKNDSLEKVAANDYHIAMTTENIKQIEIHKNLLAADRSEQKDILLQEYTDSLKYKGKPIGWFILHTYRGKNALGALVLKTSKFYIKQDFSTVTTSEDVN